MKLIDKWAVFREWKWHEFQPADALFDSFDDACEFANKCTRGSSCWTKYYIAEVKAVVVKGDFKVADAA